MDGPTGKSLKPSQAASRCRPDKQQRGKCIFNNECERGIKSIFRYKNAKKKKRVLCLKRNVRGKTVNLGLYIGEGATQSLQESGEPRSLLLVGGQRPRQVYNERDRFGLQRPVVFVFGRRLFPQRVCKDAQDLVYVLDGHRVLCSEELDESSENLLLLRRCQNPSFSFPALSQKHVRFRGCLP
jgi:hypothetical protein